ncbi:hypothetical protein T439DRAFT_351694 [Meredithblackwellia eburnea MCA 4105]
MDSPTLQFRHPYDPPPNTNSSPPAYVGRESSLRSKSSSMRSSNKGPAPSYSNGNQSEEDSIDGLDDRKDNLVENSLLTLDGFMFQMGRVQQKAETFSSNIAQLETYREKVIALPVDGLYDTKSQPILEDLATLTISTVATIEPLVKDLKVLHTKVNYLGAGSGKVFVTADETDSAKRRLVEATDSLKGSVETIRASSRVQAFHEEHKREETRIRSARRIQTHMPQLDDEGVIRLLKSAETSGRAPLSTLDVESFAGRWALENPFTELQWNLKHEDLAFLDEPVKFSSSPKSWTNPLEYVRNIGGGYAAPGTQAAVPVHGEDEDLDATGPYGSHLDEENGMDSKRKGTAATFWLMIFFGLITALVAGIIIYNFSTRSDTTGDNIHRADQTTTLILDVPSNGGPTAAVSAEKPTETTKPVL